MHAGTYIFTCRFETDALLPSFKGSTLRGGLGHALKRISCALRWQECRTCLLATTCAYAFLFEIKNETTNAPIAHRPHPYVLVPPEDDQRRFCPGDAFSFGLILFGPANQYLPHLVYAAQEMGRRGLGKKAGAKGRFLLEEVRLGEQVLFQEGVPAPPTSSALSELAFEALHPTIPCEEIILTCTTPLRLKHGNRLQEGLPFYLLIRAALRRISILENTYGSGEPSLDYKGLVARAADVRTETTDCRWKDIKRYSNRQRTAMLMGGIQGRFVYQGEGLAEFLPLLRYCEVTHLGKQTSFGLGRIRVEVECGRAS